jgi:hypothetical protein
MNPVRPTQNLPGMLAHQFIDGPAKHLRLLYDSPVYASLASIPSREVMLKATVESLFPQVTRLNVMLNEYDHVPDFLNHPKIRVERSQDVGNFRSDAMYWWIDDPGLHLFCADDLVYREDYAETMAIWIESLGRRAAVTTHAVILKNPCLDYYRDRKVYHGMAPQPVPHWCHVGAIALHTDVGDLTREELVLRPVADEREHNMSDIVLALALQRRGIPVLGIAHDGGLYSNPVRDKGIYEDSKARDGSVQDSANVQSRAVQAGDWTLFTLDQ